METLPEQIKKAQLAEENNQFFLAFNFYKSALQVALKNSDKDNILLCKSKLVETGKKASPEFRELTYEHKISQKDIDDGLKPIFEGETIQKIFFNIARYTHLFPHKTTIQKTAAESIPLSYQLFNTSTISDQGHLITNGEDSAFSWYMTNYKITQDLIMQLYLDPIFEKMGSLIEETKLFTAQNLFDYFKNSPVIVENSLPLLKVAIDRYFFGDYVSAIHILIPQFENLFLSVSEKLGIDIISINRNKGLSTNPRVLSIPLLDTTACKKNWKEDFCEQLKFILLEPLGYKLRHRVAHGEIVNEECNKSNCNLIIYLYLVILGRIETKEAMKKQEISVKINRSVEEVFKFTIDPKNTPKWIDSILEEQVDKMPIGIGTTYRNKNRQNIWTEYQVIELVKNETFTLKQKDSTYHVRYSYLELNKGASKLTYLEWAESGGIKEPFDKSAILKLKQLLENQI